MPPLWQLLQKSTSSCSKRQGIYGPQIKPGSMKFEPSHADHCFKVKRIVIISKELCYIFKLY
jgi:hypothetical protein